MILRDFLVLSIARVAILVVYGLAVAVYLPRWLAARIKDLPARPGGRGQSG
jgi:hypothetical protein